MNRAGWRYALYKIIYRSKTFSVVLLFLIILSSLAVIMQTVPDWRPAYRSSFRYIELFVTILFTIEYLLRIIAAPKPGRYVFSLVGFVDLFSIFPVYLSIFNLVSINYLMVIRLVRLFRLLRVFDLMEYTKYTREVKVLRQALSNSRRKISIFILSVLIAVTMIGSLMYLVEGPENGFVSIPKGIYWAVVTLTTVGYGDVTPQTSIGQALASLLMLLGFSTIVVFTSIVSAEIYKREEKKKTSNEKSCLDCGMDGHDSNASYCKYCGSRLWG
ncbi:MAG: ion transporter [Bacteroidia bacterium]|nr:ion transporter [Bacteroidia bacterium]